MTMSHSLSLELEEFQQSNFPGNTSNNLAHQLPTPIGADAALCEAQDEGLCIKVLDVTPTHVHEEGTWEFCITFFHYQSKKTHFIYRKYRDIRRAKSEICGYLMLVEKTPEYQAIARKIIDQKFPRRRILSHKRSDVAYERADLLKKWLENTMNMLAAVRAERADAGKRVRASHVFEMAWTEIFFLLFKERHEHLRTASTLVGGRRTPSPVKTSSSSTRSSLHSVLPSICEDETETPEEVPMQYA